MVERKPVFIDLAHGVIGKWEGLKESSREGKGIPTYYPFNSLRIAKPIEYPFPVPEDAVYGPFQPSTTSAKGRADRVVVITETSEGQPMMDKIQDMSIRRVEGVQDRLEEEKFKREVSDRKRKESEDDSEKERKKREQRSSSRRPGFLEGGGRR